MGQAPARSWTFAVFLPLVLVGCGGDSTTIIERTVADAATATQTGPEPADGFTEDDLCGRFPGGFEGQPLYLWADGVDCEVARKLSIQIQEGTGIPSAWNCGASAIGCSNDLTGSSFYVASTAGPGEQNCPAGQIAVGDDSCAPVPARRGGGRSRQGGLSESSPLTTEGLGPVLAGMSLSQAAKVAKRNFRPSDAGANSACRYYEVSGIQGVSFMVSNGEIARVDVRTAGIETLSGVQVGDSAHTLRATYGDALVSEPNFYNPDWTDYTYIPEDPSDNTRMIFAVAGDQTISSIRSGRLPEVGYVEGCS